MADGYFRSKSGFTSVQNTVAKNKDLSLKAKGLYLVIQAHITLPDSTFTKSFFFNQVCEGEKAFESCWNELKEAGYLKTHIHTKGGKFINEYELLDEPRVGAHTFYYDKDEKITKTNLDILRLPQAEENDEPSRTPKKGGTVNEGSRTPKNGIYGNGINGNGVYGNGSNGNGGNNNNTYTLPIDIESNTVNKTNNQNKGNNINNNPLLPLQTVKEEFGVKSEDEKEKVKNQISYDQLVGRHQGNKKLLAYILSQMTEMLSEKKVKTELSTGRYEDTVLVKEKLREITIDDIENLLQMLPDKSESQVKNPRGYLRTCLFNLTDRRGAICSTQQIKKKGSNEGLIHSEYDFDEIERMLR